ARRRRRQHHRDEHPAQRPSVRAHRRRRAAGEGGRGRPDAAAGRGRRRARLRNHLPSCRAGTAVTVRTGTGSGRTRPAGTARPVLAAPHPVLSSPAEPVDPTAPEVVAAAADLLATLRRLPGLTGLAAPQIGLSWRLIAFDARRHPRARSWAGELVVVNPRLSEAARWDCGREGCASVAHLTADVRRATHITLRGRLPGSGEPVTIEADAFEARCIQHQLDHLDGILFVDRVSGALSLHHKLHTSGW